MIYLSGRESHLSMTISGRDWVEGRKLINNSDLSKNWPQSSPGVLLGPKYKKLRRKTTGLIQGNSGRRNSVVLGNLVFVIVMR